MLRKLVPLFVGLALLFSVALAEEKYTLSGEVTFRKDGDIYICLLDMEGWRDFQNPRNELSQLKCQVIKMNVSLKEAKKVSFKFDNVPKGTYCIVALQDINNNGNIDRWKTTYDYFLKKISYKNNGKPILLKSLVNTAKIKQILDLYPNAKFIHIHRNPYDVYFSTWKLYKSILPLLSFQNVD